MSSEQYFLTRAFVCLALLIIAFWKGTLTLKNVAALVGASCLAGAVIMGVFYLNVVTIFGVPVGSMLGGRLALLYCDIAFLLLAGPLFALFRRLLHVRGLGWNYWIPLFWATSAYLLVVILVAIGMLATFYRGQYH